MKKRLISLLLSAAMIVSMVVVPSAAADTVTVSVDTVSGMPGETVTVGVNVSNLTENDYVGAFQIEIPFDADSLEVVMQPSGRTQVAALPNSDLWSGGTLRSNLKDGDTITFGGMNADGWVGNGAVCTIQFKIKADVAVESVELPITVKSFTLLGATAAEDQRLSVDEGTLAITDGAVDVIFPVTAITGDAKQETVTSATLNGEYELNVDGVTVDASGIKWGTAEDALNNTAAFGDTVTAAQGDTVYYQAYATVGDATYYGDVESIVLAGPTATDIEVALSADEVEVDMDGETVTATATVYDQFAGEMAGAEVTWSVSEAQGVTINADGVISVDNTALDATVTVTAACGNASGSAELTVDRPDPVVDAITASASVSTIDVPTAAVGAATVELTATGVDQFEQEIAVDVEWSVSEAEGVSVEGNVLTVTNKAAAGTVTVTAQTGDITDSFELTITKAASVPAEIAFAADEATMSIPTGETPNSRDFAAVVTDQFGDEMAAEVTYALTGDEFVSNDGCTVTVKQGATAETQYTLTATAGSVSDSMVITVVDIEMTWPTETVAADATYGDTWADIVKLASDGSASLDGANVPGEFSVVDADVTPNAGEQTYTVQFISDDGAYNVTKTGTATIAKADIEADWSGFKGLTYGDEVNVTAQADVALTVTDNTNANAGTYTAKAAIAGDAANNYNLTNPEQEYTVAQAEATITVAAQTIRAGKNGEQLAAQIGAIQADGVNGEKIDGTLTVEDEISGKTPSSKAVKVNVSFAHENANYVSPVAGTVMVTFTEGDPQTVTVNNVTATYGDAAKANAAVVTAGGSGAITYVSDNEAVATVAADGTVTFVAAGEATVTVTVAADGDWAETSTSYTVTVAPKAVTVSGVTVADKVYDATTKATIDAASAVVEGKVGEDDVTVDASKAKAEFAQANAGENIAVTVTGIALTGAAADNYTLSAQPAATASITKIAAADVVAKLEDLTQRPGKVEPLTVDLDPATDDAVLTVEYYVVDVPADEEAGTEATYKWTTEVPQEKGEYPVKATVTSANIEGTVVIEDVLKVKASSGGGGGGGSSSSKPEEPEEPEVPETPAEPEITFVDVVETDWFAPAVAQVAAKGLFAGNDKNEFLPNAKMTRAMMVTVLAAVEFGDKGAPEGESSFTDLTADWYKNAVAWAASNKVTAGISETEFAPDMALTREQVAVFLYAYAQLKGVDVSVGEDTNILSYNDAFDVDEWAIPAMQWACGAGLIGGTPEGNLLPLNTATRAEVAVILNNFSNLLAD